LISYDKALSVIKKVLSMKMGKIVFRKLLEEIFLHTKNRQPR